MTNILDLIQQETGYAYRRETPREFGGPCPFCRTGTDRFNIWPHEGRYWCRQCGRSGDAIQFMRDFRHLGFQQAVEYLSLLGFSVERFVEGNLHERNRASARAQASAQPLVPPSARWCERGWAFVFDSQRRLMADDDKPRARAWLNSERALSDDTLRKYGIGYWPHDRHEDRALWGLPDNRKELWLPRGIVIPWQSGKDLWGIRIRRPAGDPKYYWIPGGTAPALYGADLLTASKPAMLVEGEFDALSLRQAADDLVAAVATGSTMGARRTKWLARLALAPLVLVAFDCDDAGEEASRYWLDALDNARR
ncbi:MAG: toprim domain-containing protein, partial [Caldilineaceae bacterium]|nr:toprim domain-containing protein [Caldilineaceae bacterium]